VTCRCAQSSDRLVGVSPQGCTPLTDSKGVVFKSSRAAWEATFDAMAASNKRWEFAMHAHFGWCLKRFRVRCSHASGATWPRQRLLFILPTAALIELHDWSIALF
jgi:hypothetical protein